MQAKADHISAMGAELGTIYDGLWQQVARVHGKWADYVAIFGTKESRVKLLNDAAPAFCKLVQDSLWENVLIHIARLTDPVAMGGKQNLTTQRLPKLIEYEDTRIKIEGAVKSALAACEFARDWRNRHIAHCDLELTISDTARPLESASRQKVIEALRALSEILNALSSRYLDSTSFFELDDGDAIALLYVLDDGLESARRRRERLQNGIYDPDEYKPRDL